MSPLSRIAALLTALTLVLAACAGDEGDDDGLEVVATTSIVGDIVTRVLGDRGTMSVLMPPGVDPHAYQPTPGQAAQLRSADLVVMVGLGLEEGLVDIIDSARADGARVVQIGPFVTPLQVPGTDRPDPHFWMDPLRVGDAALLVADSLSAVDPDRRDDYLAAAEQYAAELDALDQTIRDLLATVPETRRKLVTNHDTLGYFADRYGFEIIGTIVPAASTLATPGPARMEALAKLMAETGVPAVFVDSEQSTADAEALAARVRELGGAVEVVTLFTGTLGPDGSDADTYLRFLGSSAEVITRALADVGPAAGAAEPSR